ncbi:MAG: hypothetical protein DMF90_18500, partial [Acidobacteria bacterium]
MDRPLLARRQIDPGQPSPAWQGTWRPRVRQRPRRTAQPRGVLENFTDARPSRRCPCDPQPARCPSFICDAPARA